MSTIIATGNITAEPELRFTPAGKAVANFTIAENHRTKQGDAYVDDGATFYRIAAWGSLAENAAESLHKGDRVTVTGQFRTREYTTRDGVQGRSLDITADTVGPDLRWATARVEKAGRSGFGGGQQPQGDTWGSAPQQDTEAPF